MAAPSGSIDTPPVRRGPYADGPGRYNGWAITSYFGGRIDPITGRPGNHGGEDLAHGLCFGEPIIAPIGGLLSQGWDPGGGGNWSGITGHNQDYWGFGHASRFAWVGGGSRWVNPGDVIAFVGNTGKSTGAHLHVAFRPAGASGYRDPFDALASYVHDNTPASGPAPTQPTEQEIYAMTIATVKGDLRWQPNSEELYLVCPPYKLYIPATSSGGVSGDTMKASLIANGHDATNVDAPGNAEYLEVFKTLRP